jgi:Holliday junction resolvase
MQEEKRVGTMNEQYMIWKLDGIGLAAARSGASGPSGQALLQLLQFDIYLCVQETKVKLECVDLDRPVCE